MVDVYERTFQSHNSEDVEGKRFWCTERRGDLDKPRQTRGENR
jgi:hypothetical protein